jgi:serine/threonine protein kinase/Flp pilus assembly protein TadD
MVKTPPDPPRDDPHDQMPADLPRSSQPGSPASEAGADAAPSPSAQQSAVDGEDLLARAQDAVRPQSTFAPGEILADRFRIQRFIAQGGAGEVYEAEDLELRVRVALKVVRPEIAENEQAIGRFRREIQLARQVTHPNVCRIFDVFRHQIPDSRPGRPPRRFLFLTMELLAGESLASLLHRRGPLTAGQALPIVRDMVAGLRAAHEAGVVHRDFKSANVVLVQRNGGMRAVITDFGLARSDVVPETLTANITQSGTVVGTPTYMAPEQLTGGEITAAADVYSLGIVLFETVTGLRPFKGETDLSTAVKRLTEAPPSPRVHAPDLDPRWEGAILRCLQRDPSARYADLGDLVTALEGTAAGRPLSATELPWPGPPSASHTTTGLSAEASEHSSSTSRPVLDAGWRARPSRARLVSLTALLTVAVASGFALSKVTDPWRVPPPELDFIGMGRSKVAVLAFKNLAGQRTDDWMAAALQEMVNMELAAGGQLEPVPSESVDRVARDLRSGEAGGLALDTISKIGKRLGAPMVVDGSYLKNGSEIRLHLRLHTEGSPVLLTVPGQEDQLFDLVSRAGAELRGRLGLAEFLGRVEALDDGTEAGELYARGLTELHRFDGKAARRSFTAALETDPIHAEAYAGLAAALELLGHEDEARRASRRAVDLSAPLVRELKLVIEANDSLVRDDFERAADLYGSLFRFFPDNLEYGLGLVRALAGAGRGDQALVTLTELRRLDTATLAEPRLELFEAIAAAAASNPRHQLEAARRAVSSALSGEAPLLAAEGRLLEAGALVELGSGSAGETAARRAKQIFEEANVRRGSRDALRLLTRVARQRGDRATAERLEREADALERELATEELVGDREREGTEGDVARALHRPDRGLGERRVL